MKSMKREKVINANYYTYVICKGTHIHISQGTRTEKNYRTLLSTN